MLVLWYTIKHAREENFEKLASGETKIQHLQKSTCLNDIWAPKYWLESKFDCFVSRNLKGTFMSYDLFCRSITPAKYLRSQPRKGAQLRKCWGPAQEVDFSLSSCSHVARECLPYYFVSFSFFQNLLNKNWHPLLFFPCYFFFNFTF